MGKHDLIAAIGHNGAPDPLDDALSPFGDAITESETWLDGTTVENEGQMKAVDALRKVLREARQAVEAAEKSEAAPLHDAWKAAKARYKPTLDDLGRIEKGLVALVDGFKRKLAEKKEAELRAARAAEAEARRAAEEAARAASASDIDAQRAAAEAQAAAEDAAKRAAVASKDQVKGLRTVPCHEITDERAALFWIAANDRTALAAFVAEYVRTHPDYGIEGVRRWTEKRAY